VNIKKEDLEKLKVLALKFHKKYPQFSHLEVEHQQMCGIWKQKKCNCRPAARVFTGVVE